MEPEPSLRPPLRSVFLVPGATRIKKQLALPSYVLWRSSDTGDKNKVLKGTSAGTLAGQRAACRPGADAGAGALPGQADPPQPSPLPHEPGSLSHLEKLIDAVPVFLICMCL